MLQQEGFHSFLQATKALRLRRGKALFFLGPRYPRWGWGVSPTPRLPLPPEKTRYPFYRRQGGCFLIVSRNKETALFRLSVTSPRVSRFLCLCWRYRVQISGQRPAIMTTIFYSVPRFYPGKSWDIIFSQATAGSFFILSNLLLSNRNIGRIITLRTKRTVHHHHVACRVLGLMTFSGPIKSL